VAIILDERSFAENLLKTKKYGRNYVPLKILVLLAKYFKYSGKETREIKKLLKEICKSVDPTFNETTQSWKIGASIREMKKRRIRTVIPIPITEAELEKIRAINDYDLQKVMFVFLVYSKVLKYNDTKIKPRKSPRVIGLFYTNEKDNVIFSVARVNVTKKKRKQMLHVLYDLKVLDANRWGGFQVKCAAEDSPTVFMVEDYENIVLYYQRFLGETVVSCSCGRLFLKKTKSPFCHRCKQENRKFARKKWRNKSYHVDKEKLYFNIE